MQEPMNAPIIESGAGPRSSSCSSNQGQSHPSQSPGYHSAASSPSSSSISSPVSSTSSGASANSSSSGISSSSSSSSSAMSSSSTLSPQHSSSVTVPSRAPSASFSMDTITAAQINPNIKIEQSQQLSKPIVNNRGNQVASNRQQANGNNNNNSANMSSSLYEFFPELNHDGAMLTWFHGANNRASLITAIMSNKMFVSGDISLAEMSRYPVPIMARPPLGVSDLTLENWLADMTRTQKGIKLTFTSTRTVEPAFRVLARHAEHLKGPLILSADILTRSVALAPSSQNNRGHQNKQQQQQAQSNQPVDAWTFLMLCRTRFPKSIISIGWCSAQTSLSSVELPQSLASSSDSMFELDIDNQHQVSTGSYLETDASRAPGPVSAAPTANVQQQALMQQLAAAAAAARAHHQLPSGLTPASNQAAPNIGGTLTPYRLSPGSISIHNYHNNNSNSGNNSQRNHHRHHHHKHLSSSGSLSSNSSGNSSGSPSPTSPLSHHLSHHNHNNHHSHHHHHQLHLSHLSHLSHQQHSHQTSDSPESHHQLLLAAAAAAASQQNNGDRPKCPDSSVDWSAAVAAAAMVAASSLQQQQQDNLLPLNLNINEADPKHTNSSAGLSDLAHRIQSSIRHQNGAPIIALNATSTSSNTSSIMNLNKIQLAKTNHKSPNSGVSRQTNGATANSQNWQHINKKAAITNCLNSNSPSPISTSPKQQQKAANLLCVSKPQQQQQQQQQQASVNLKSQQQPQCTEAGYTREMIDKMASLVREYNLTQPITFPVEARLLLRNNNSFNELQRLLYQVGSNSTLTIVAQPEDLIGVDDLLQMRRHFLPQQILFDLPDDLATALRYEIELM